MPKIYSPLSASQDEFRVVELFPASEFNAPIVCQLVLSSLRSPPEYEALSYAWGLPPFSASITLNDSLDFTIGENLELALRYLRLPSKKRLLWVDALCINQGDRDERSQQVGRMRDVFQLCQAVLVYLGPYYPKSAKDENEFHSYEELKSLKEGNMKISLDRLMSGLVIMDKISDKDISTLKDMKDNKKRRKMVMYDMPSDECSEDESMEIQTAESMNQSAEDSNLKDTEWLLDNNQKYALYEVFTDSLIWNRVWIVQELSCARRAVLVGGTSTLEWEKVSSFLGDTVYADAFHAPFGHGSVDKITSHVFSNAAIVNHQRGIFRDMGKGYISTLFDVLARFRRTKATDNRDKIYGLLGLVSEEHSISPDYKKTYQQVFTDVAVSIINNSATLDILCQSPWSDQLHPETSGLPSWVPDFTYSGHPLRLFAQRGVFSAGAPTCRTPCRVTEDGTLILPGIILGQIGPFHASIDDTSNDDHVYSFASTDDSHLDDIPDEASKGASKDASDDASDASDHDSIKLTQKSPGISGHNSQINSPQGSSQGPIDSSTKDDPTTSFSDRWSNYTPEIATLPQKWMKQYFGSHLLEEPDSKYITGEPSLQAYWCTLLASCTFPPIKRLTPSEIAEFGNTFTAVLRGDVPARDLCNQVYYPMLERMFKQWSFALTTSGLYIMIQAQHDHVKEGDSIVVLQGAKLPVVLRSMEKTMDGDEMVKYRLISTAYVHGFMNGEAIKWVNDGKLKEQEFLLA